MKKVFLGLCLLFSANVMADKPTCHSSNGGYCSYYGYVERIYVNKGGLILLYFDTAMDEGEWDKAGFNARKTVAGAIKLEDNPEFAKLFYSTALSAQATKRKISIQMRGVLGGYLVIDRIWLAE